MSDIVRFAWKSSYVVGDPVIDTEHKALIDLANLLYDAVKRGKGEAVIASAFDALGLYTVRHFKDEELFFEKIASPMLERHRQQHQILVRELGALREEGMLGFVDGAPDALESWVEDRLIAHMIHDDQDTYRAATRPAAPRRPQRAADARGK